MFFIFCFLLFLKYNLLYGLKPINSQIIPFPFGNCISPIKYESNIFNTNPDTVYTEQIIKEHTPFY